MKNKIEHNKIIKICLPPGKGGQSKQAFWTQAQHPTRSRHGTERGTAWLGAWLGSSSTCLVSPVEELQTRSWVTNFWTSGKKGVKARLLDYLMKSFQQSLLLVTWWPRRAKSSAHGTAVCGSAHGQITHPEPQTAGASSAWFCWGVLDGWPPAWSTNKKLWPTTCWSSPDPVLCERKRAARSIYRVRPKCKVRSWPHVLFSFNHIGKQLRNVTIFCLKAADSLEERNTR